MKASKQIKITAAIIIAIFIIIGSAHADMWVIEPGYVGIGTQTPESPFEVEQTFTNENGDALKVDLTLDGTISGGDKTNTGILVNISGGSLAGDSYPSILGTKNSLDLHGDGLVGIGTLNSLSYDGIQPKLAAYAVGSHDYVSNINTGSIVYGFGHMSTIENSHDGTIALGIGHMSVIDQKSSTGTITYGAGFHTTLKNESGGTFGEGTLFHGEFLGSFTQEKQGIFLSGEDKNYFSGNVGIGTSAPTNKLEVIGNVLITGKTTHQGGFDPPYILYDYETRQSIMDRVMDEVPTEKLRGAVMFFNGETSQMEVFIPNTGEFRSIEGEILEVTQPIAGTYETEDRYYFDEETGKVKKYKVKKVTAAEKKHKIKEDHFIDHKTGKFYKKIRNEEGIWTDETEVSMVEALEE